MSTQIRYRMENAIEPKDIATSDVIQAEIPEMENIHNLIWTTQALMTLPEADERYIERWEQSLGIKSPSSHMEDRRRFLITSISSKQKTSSRTLEVHSETFTGVQNRVFIEGSTINIRFLGGLSDTSISRFRDFIELLIPAHLGLQIIIDVPMDELQYMYAFGGDQVSELSLIPEQTVWTDNIFTDRLYLSAHEEVPATHTTSGDVSTITIITPFQEWGNYASLFSYIPRQYIVEGATFIITIEAKISGQGSYGFELEFVNPPQSNVTPQIKELDGWTSLSTAVTLGSNVNQLYGAWFTVFGDSFSGDTIQYRNLRLRRI